MCAVPSKRPAAPRESGAAIVLALLVVFLATVLSTQLLSRVNEWIDEASLMRDRQQAVELARGGLDWASAILVQDARSSALDTLQEDWAQRRPALRHEWGEVGGEIDDEQARLNLNSLRLPDGRIDESALTAYRRLLALLGLPDALADTLADWLDADDARRALGEEKGAANAPLEQIQRLADIRGYDSDTRQRLAPYVTTFDDPAPINLNTAPPEILAAIQPGLGLGSARSLLAQRQLPFRDLGDYQQRLGSGFPPPLVQAGVNSRHFHIAIVARSGQAQVRLEARLLRLGNGSRNRMTWQNLL